MSCNVPYNNYGLCNSIAYSTVVQTVTSCHYCEHYVRMRILDRYIWYRVWPKTEEKITVHVWSIMAIAAASQVHVLRYDHHDLLWGEANTCKMQIVKKSGETILQLEPEDEGVSVI